MLNLGFETCEFGLRMAYFCNVYNILISKKKKKYMRGTQQATIGKKFFVKFLSIFFAF